MTSTKISPPMPDSSASPGRIHSHHGYGGGGGGVGAENVPCVNPIATVTFSSGPRSTSPAVNDTAPAAGSPTPAPVAHATTSAGHSATVDGWISHVSVDPSAPE